MDRLTAAKAVLTLTLMLNDDTGSKQITFVEVNGVRVSDSCPGGRCRAGVAAAARRPAAEPALSARGTALPSYAVLCQALKGKNVILEDTALNQFNFCRFADGSLLSLDDLDGGSD